MSQFDMSIPHEAAQIVADHCFVGRFHADAALLEAAPLVAAAELEQFASSLREVLHKLPEYTHGCLAWRVLNDIDDRIVALRRGQVHVQVAPLDFTEEAS